MGDTINPFAKQGDESNESKAQQPGSTWINPNAQTEPSAPTTQAKNELLKDLPVSENKEGHDRVDSEITAAVSAIKEEIKEQEKPKGLTRDRASGPETLREKILREHGGLESNIPINHRYWNLPKVRNRGRG